MSNNLNFKDSSLDMRHTDAVCVNESALEHPWYYQIKYLIVGILFGIVFVKAEIVSWFRIQEMFRLESFHMYGVIGSAVVVGALSVWLIKRFKIRTIHGEEIRIAPKKFNKGQVYGGLLFGFGWAMTGACPGPLFAILGTGATVALVMIIFALFGTWVYGYFRERLPH